MKSQFHIFASLRAYGFYMYVYMRRVRGQIQIQMNVVKTEYKRAEASLNVPVIDWMINVLIRNARAYKYWTYPRLVGRYSAPSGLVGIGGVTTSQPVPVVYTTLHIVRPYTDNEPVSGGPGAEVRYDMHAARTKSLTCNGGWEKWRKLGCLLVADRWWLNWQSCHKYIARWCYSQPARFSTSPYNRV